MKSSLKFLAAAFAVSLMYVGSAGAFNVTGPNNISLGQLDPWPATAATDVVNFEARVGNHATDGAWELGHSFHGSYLDQTGQAAWLSDINNYFTLTHDSSTGDFTLETKVCADSDNSCTNFTTISTTWQSGRKCQKISEIWLMAKSALSTAMVVKQVELDGANVTNAFSATNVQKYIRIDGELFENFTLTGQMTFNWSGTPNPDDLEIFMSVVFENTEAVLDPDGDGYGEGDHITYCDCNNTDDTVYPGAAEICDGQDNNCDAILPADEVDNDGDQYAVCSLDSGGWDGTGTVVGGDDCDDNDLSEYPGIIWYADADLDTFGNPDLSSVCERANLTDVLNSSDCDDTDATVYSGAPELCDGQDNNCDGTTPADEVDNDGDHYAKCTLDSGGWDGVGTVNGGDDCVDTVAAINPGALENCNNGIDDNCNEVINGPIDGCQANAQGEDGITYDSLQSAYDYIYDGDTIKIQAGEMGGLTLRDVTVTLAGGYDNSSFSEAERNGWTVISAPLIIWQGKVIAEYIIIL